MVLVLSLSASAALPEVQAEKVVNAIYRLEGGAQTKYPYGVRSVKTADPRRVCYRTVQNTHNRWIRAGRPGQFFDYLADRYCPKASDPIGNIRWKRNIRKLT